MGWCKLPQIQTPDADDQHSGHEALMSPPSRDPPDRWWPTPDELDRPSRSRGQSCDAVWRRRCMASCLMQLSRSNIARCRSKTRFSNSSFQASNSSIIAVISFMATLSSTIHWLSPSMSRILSNCSSFFIVTWNLVWCAWAP